jgi:signal transduction histidine kinase
MLGLRSKIVFSILLLLAGVTGIGHFFMERKIVSFFYELEHDIFLSDSQRIRHAFLDSIDQIRVKAKDWATWDDSYYFMQNKLDSYLNSLNVLDNFLAVRTDLVVYLKPDLQVHHSLAFDFKRSSEIPLDPEFLEALRTSIQSKDLLKQLDAQGLSALIRSRSKAYGIAILPILLNDQSKPANGYLVWGRTITEHDEAVLSKSLGYPIKIYLADPSQPEELQRTTNLLQGVFFKSADDEHMQITQLFLDAQDRAALTITTKLPRRIHKLGLQMLSEVVIWVGFLLLLAGAAVFLLVDRMVVAPLRKISNQASHIEDFASGHRITVQSNDELQSLVGSVNKMLDTLQVKVQKVEEQQLQLIQSAKMASLGEMAGGVAHEINNPLAIISGYASIIETQLKSPQFDQNIVIKHAAQIQKSVERIGRIVKGLRSFSRETALDPKQSTTLLTIVDDVCHLCTERIKHEEVEFSMDREFLLEHQTWTLLCRPTEIEQALLNLISNSLDAIRSQSERWIRLEFYATSQVLGIRVLDSGPGVPAEIYEKIFQPFFTTKELGKGTGLGLSISRGLLESNDGCLFLDTNATNTCFVLELPHTREEQFDG